MKRLTFSISEIAYEIYQKVKSHDRSKFVSDAIIEKDRRDNSSTEARLDNVEKKLAELEGKIGKR